MKTKKILIVKNFTTEGPGLIEIILKENNLRYDIIDLSRGKSFPEPYDYSAIFVLGGPDSANDNTPKMQSELKGIKRAIDASIPYFGVCLGMQTLVKAAGGDVYRNPVKEIGCADSEGDYFEIELTNEGREDPLFEGIESKLKIFQLHGETVRLPSSAHLLATGRHCKNQAVEVGKNAYGFQGHLELTPAMFAEWINADSELKNLDAQSLRRDYDKLKSEYGANGRKILNNFLKLADLNGVKTNSVQINNK